MLKRIWKFAKWSICAAVITIVLLLLPVGYVETFCRQDAAQSSYKPIITDEQFARTEANSYLTYPEWHIVYAYEGLAEILKSNDEHAFNYFSSIKGFWVSFCDLNKIANSHGGGDFDTRGTVHTIGVSFTFEMVMKALYEETLGRLFAAVRGEAKTPQDIYAKDMAADYAGFLQQVPWYKYDFNTSVDKLWQAPVTSTLRGWERRLALGGEWKAKATYANVIAEAVKASGDAPLRIRSVVDGISEVQLASNSEIKIIAKLDQGILIEADRYRKFTNILVALAKQDAKIVEIAGNDEIMLSAIGHNLPDAVKFENAELISRIKRDGFDSERFLMNVPLSKLSSFLNTLPDKNLVLEHIYDY